MNHQEFMDILHELIVLDLDDGCTQIQNVQPSDEAASMPNGLLVRTKDGSTFRLCMVQVA